MKHLLFQALLLHGVAGYNIQNGSHGNHFAPTANTGMQDDPSHHHHAEHQPQRMNGLPWQQQWANNNNINNAAQMSSYQQHDHSQTQLHQGQAHQHHYDVLQGQTTSYSSNNRP